ncbi:MAG: type I restriction enzyme HsdR N-terminal domain-containing protein [Gammaproteobacteria bacterium]|nr:type I restriction enzyme HsdR N-terminal domain-containing protein [Gammaproteobacteria bacterium]MCY4283435.1 type I restriction enzyme HsdR N-terminal domain-containing protein [Gammaproteobacteria bacterium]MCY4338831.1 type I restriction enzyme HsdR N-terminal domain-containing protein [Gammaproteobacteria bacterium]
MSSQKKTIKNLTFRSQLKAPRRYKRAGKSVYLCTARKMFIQATEEERVRQEFIIFLRDKVGVPEKMLYAEKAMSHYKRGARGRADIVGHATTEKPLFVVECKKPETPLTQDVFEQAKAYADCSGSGIVLITNGIDTEVEIQENGEWLRAKGILTYKEMMKIKDYDYKKPGRRPWKRPAYKNISKAIEAGRFNFGSNQKGHRDYGCFGVDSPVENRPFFANLVGLLLDETESPKLPIRKNNITVREDLKLRYSSFGNAAGGGYTSHYRGFVVNDKNDDDQIVSLSITGTMSRKGHPKLGNRRGNTQLNLAIDDFEKRPHHSLQLDMDRFVKRSAQKALIWHNGRMTAGNKGSVPRDLVLEYISVNSPHLLRGNTVLLGELPIDRNIGWQDARRFLINCIEYALLRDEYRGVYRGKA